jgi:hypothetical protein
MKRLALILAPWLVLASAALAQGVLQQAGPATQGHVPAYANPAQVGSLPVVTDGGPASGGGPGVGLSELNVTARGNGTTSAPFPGQGTGPNGEVSCIMDAPTTNAAGYHYLCFSANIGSNNAVISIGTGGIATPGALTFIINGTTVTPVTCSGTPSSSFAAINGIVTHC